jgi:hypothetical protein
MKRTVLFALACVTTFSLSAQQNTPRKPSTWKLGGTFSIMGGQTGTRNWAPAGSEKLTITGIANLNLFANKTWGRNSWENNLELSYALIKTTSQGFRKIDDKFEFVSKYNYQLKGNSGVGVLGILRTQITNGYDYSESVKKRISGFFAPAFLSASAGYQFHSTNKAFGFHAGPAVRWVIVTNNPYSLRYQGGVKPDGSVERTLANLYNVDPTNKVRFNPGAQLSSWYRKDVVKNVNWRSRLDLNLDFNQSSIKQTDIYWTNMITMSVNKWLKVFYNFDLYSDKDIRMWGPDGNETRTQLKSILGVGVGVGF